MFVVFLHGWLSHSFSGKTSYNANTRNTYLYDMLNLFSTLLPTGGGGGGGAFWPTPSDYSLPL